MTREIKFRAWDKTRKCFVNLSDFGNLIFPIDGGEKIIKLNHSDQVELMQYCGLKDKNGKEIYQDDIHSSNKGNWVVKFGDWEFWDGVSLIPMNGWYSECLTKEGNSHAQVQLSKDTVPHIEIIGNIYENPELLK